MSLLDANAYAELTSENSSSLSTCTAKQRVVPGNADASYIIKKLEKKTFGTNVDCGTNTGMPASGTALTSTQIDTIANWINQGAMNN